MYHIIYHIISYPHARKTLLNFITIIFVKNNNNGKLTHTHTHTHCVSHTSFSRSLLPIFSSKFSPHPPISNNLLLLLSDTVWVALETFSRLRLVQNNTESFCEHTHTHHTHTHTHTPHTHTHTHTHIYIYIYIWWLNQFPELHNYCWTHFNHNL